MKKKSTEKMLLKVLYLEDSPQDIEIIREVLTDAGFELEMDCTDVEKEAVSFLRRGSYDLILSDFKMPGFDAFGALRLSKEICPNVPFICVSGSIGEEMAIELLKRGTVDYVLKDRLARLPTAIKRALEEVKEKEARRKAEEALGESEQRFKTIFDNANDGILLANGATRRFHLGNDTICRMLGYTPDELKNLGLTDIHPQEDLPYVIDQFEKQLRKEIAIAQNLPVKRKDGSIFYADVSAFPITLAGENYIVGSFRDITERKRVESALQEQQALLCQAEEIGKVGGWVFDIDTKQQTWTKAVYDIHELDNITCQPTVVQGLNFYTPASRPIIEQAVQRAIDQGESFDVELEIITAKGNLRNVHAVGKADLARGKVGGFFQDITERKLAEIQIRQQLERLSALRTIDLAITSSLDLRVTLNVILDQVTSQLQIDASSILLMNPHAHILEFVAARGFRTTALKYTKLRIGEGYAGRAAQERRIVFIPNLQDEKNPLKSSPLLTKEGFSCYYGVPLLAKGQIKGVLEIFHRKPIDPDQEWLDFLEALAGQAAIAIDNASLFDELQKLNIDLVLAYDSTLEGWSTALDLRDHDTEGHTLRVTDLTLQLARDLGMSEPELVHVRRGALLHDIGKMGIPDAILNKPGKLSDEEWGIMKKHPGYAYAWLSPIGYLRPALDIPYSHHEKWDGTGYPRGLKGEHIPHSARIFAVIDVWDALISNRPYRPAWSQEKALAHIQEQVGKHFDPKVVAKFVELLHEQAE